MAGSESWAFGWAAVESLATAAAAVTAVTVWIVDGVRRARARARAVAASVRLAPKSAEMVVANYADVPALDVLAGEPDHPDNFLTIGVLYPGERRVSPTAPPAMHLEEVHAILAFTIDGRRWQTGRDGKLHRIRRPPRSGQWWRYYKGATPLRADGKNRRFFL